MKLTRLRVEQLRQFRQPLEISGFEPGLNVFTGPNEAGKSTLVAAIRAAFFERHRSKSVDDLQPWGDTAAAPTIELDFTLNGQPCRLAKRFLGRARCDLQLGARQFVHEGDLGILQEGNGDGVDHHGLALGVDGQLGVGIDTIDGIGAKAHLGQLLTGLLCQGLEIADTGGHVLAQPAHGAGQLGGFGTLCGAEVTIA